MGVHVPYGCDDIKPCSPHNKEMVQLAGSIIVGAVPDALVR